MKKILPIILFYLLTNLSAFAAFSEIENIKVEISGTLKLKKEFSLPKLDPLYFLGGLKKIEMTELANNKTEIKVLFDNDLFSEDTLESPEKVLKTSLNNLSDLPHQISEKLNSKDPAPICASERKPHSTALIGTDFILKNIQNSLLAFATFHALKLQSSEINKDKLTEEFNLLRQSIEGTMDRIYLVEKKPEADREALLKKYGISKKDADAKDALFKTMDLLQEAKTQLKQSTTANKKISTRLSIEREGISYILTFEK